MTQYFCEFCGNITNKKNEYQCPSCLTTDALHKIEELYTEEEEDIELSRFIYPD